MLSCDLNAAEQEVVVLVEKKQRKGMSDEKRNALALELFPQMYGWRAKRNLGYVKYSPKSYLQELREAIALHVEFTKISNVSTPQERAQWIEKQIKFELKMNVNMEERLANSMVNTAAL